MKFSKSGRIVLALLVTLGVGFGITSCSSDYTIGYLYVTGTATDNSSSGQVTGFKISNNTGVLTQIPGSPFGTSGENPKRALVLETGRFLYVLNQGDLTTGAGGNVALFFIGGRGALSFQSSYSSQGTAPVTIVADSSGNHIYVVDKYGPRFSSPGVLNATPCVDPSGTPHPVGVVTVFTVDSNTGRLVLVTNTQQRDANNANLTYFPVGCFPIDSAVAGGNLYTLQKGTAATGDLQSVFVYSALGTGQLTLTANSTLATGAFNLTAIDTDGTNVYLLDAGPNPTSTTNVSQILPYTVGSGGALATAVGGVVQNDPTVQDPVALLVEARTHQFLYVANAGPNTSTDGTAASSAISAFNRAQNLQLSLFTTQEPFPSGVSPRCIVEDPSNQYIYTANHDSNTVSGKLLNTSHGTLTPLRKATTFPTGGNPTWCVVSSRTQ